MYKIYFNILIIVLYQTDSFDFVEDIIIDLLSNFQNILKTSFMFPTFSNNVNDLYRLGVY